MEEYKDYLGDSVYAAIEDGMVKLTTKGCMDDSNTIYLEPEVLDALYRYVDRVKALYEERRKTQLEQRP